MSRIGRMPIDLPHGAAVTIRENQITVKGPKGELTRRVHPRMSVSVEGNKLRVTRPTDIRTDRALHGLTRSLIANMVEGVTRGFEKNLEIVGVGYRVTKAGDKLALRLGFSHPVELSSEPDVKLDAEGLNRIKVMGIDRERVGEIAARIRAIKPPDHFKGKGIRYVGEVVHLKAGKTAKATGTTAK